ncbi:MAG: Gfo/Idh/MocA family oxidoreductase [bacterium]
MKRVKVGIIGCGVMGSFHLKQYGTIPEVEIVGTSDVDPSRATQGVKFFNKYKDLLKATDAVSITTPTSTHFDVAMAALDAGCHVLIEKPISITSDQGKKLIKKAKAKRKVLAVGHIERFNPAYMALAEQLGKKIPDLIDIKRFSPFPARITDASCVIDMMIHDIDLARHLAGSQVKHINVIGKKIRTNRLDQALAVLVFKNGVVANIETNRVHVEKIRKVTVAGMKGIFEADLLGRSLKISTAGKSKNIGVKPFDQLNFELKDFVNAIIKKRKPSVTGEDGLSALEIANKIEEAALRSC